MDRLAHWATSLTLVLLVACTRETGPHPSLQRGIQAFERISAETGGTDFGDPAFDEAVQHLEQVPKSSPDYETAKNLIDSIRTDREKHEARAAAEREAAHRRVAEEAAKEAALQQRVRQMAVEGRLEADERARQRAKEDAEAKAAFERRRAEAGRVAEKLATKRKRKKDKIRRDREAREARRRQAEIAREDCEKRREACRSRCMWVRDGTNKTGGLGSPISMKCMQRCPVCEGN